MPRRILDVAGLPNSLESNSIDTLLNIGLSSSPALQHIVNTARTRSRLTNHGLIMLGAQHVRNIRSNAEKRIPKLDPFGYFDKGSLGDMFVPYKNYRITKPSGTGDWLKRLADGFLGFHPNIYSPFRSFPLGEFSSATHTKSLLDNTGKAQLGFLFRLLNKNQFQNYHYYFNNWADNNNYELTNVRRQNLSIPPTIPQYNPYKSTGYDVMVKGEYESVVSDLLRNSKINSYDKSKGYAPNQDFIDNNFGSTINKQGEQVIWGFDGNFTDNMWYEENYDLKGDFEYRLESQPNSFQKFKIKSGLLKNTHTQMIHSGGQRIDMTRKRFYKDASKDDFLYQGAGDWERPDFAPKKQFEDGDKKGIRQHTILDKYDRFAKAIRYDGNQIYDNNKYNTKNSVIYKNVIPRVHPTIDGDGNINNRNLMFSIENLAVQAISVDRTKGLLEDGSYLPVSEVGPNMGRLMWFPPYDINFNETTSNTFESTVMMGRGEPIYNYQHSERTGTLRFKLLIDHPEHSKFHNIDEINKFYLYGTQRTQPKEEEPFDENPPPPIEDIIEEVVLGEPPEIDGVVFPHNVPTNISKIDTIFDDMYRLRSYEIGKEHLSKEIVESEYKIGEDKKYEPDKKEMYNNSGNLNKNILYYNENHSKRVDNNQHIGEFEQQYNNYYYMIIDSEKVGDFSQYEYNKQNPVKIDDDLREFFTNPLHRKYFKIRLKGGATKIFADTTQDGDEYNARLATARAKATKHLLEKRLEGMFPEGEYKEINIELIETTVEDIREGDDLKKDDDGYYDEGELDRKVLSQDDGKKERNVEIEIRIKEGETPDPKDSEQLNEDGFSEGEIKQIQETVENRERWEERKNRQQRWGYGGYGEYLYKHRNQNNSAILENYDAIEDNYYYPGFNTQTPEEFHRRLTFLQQCCRQGPAIRHEPKEGEGGILRASNSVFGRQPVLVLRVGDFQHTKIIIENLNIEYTESTWDLNPEGFGVQPMFAEVTLQIKIIGGQSLEIPIAAIQNAISANYYANSSYRKDGLYKKPWEEADSEKSHRDDIFTQRTQKLRKELTERGFIED